MKRVAMLSHTPDTSPGRLGDVLDEAGVAWSLVPMYESEEAGPEGGEPVVVLGGPMGAYEEAAHPFLAAEKDLVRRLVADGVPVLGICLGSQLLADALGGRAYRAAVPEVGLVELTRTPSGLAHPVLSTLEDPVLAIHQDTFELPPGAELLAHTDAYPHAFQIGSALAFQFHAEATPGIVAAWMERPGMRDLIGRAGRNPQDVLDEVGRFADRSRRQGMRLFEAWLGAVLP